MPTSANATRPRQTHAQRPGHRRSSLLLELIASGMLLLTLGCGGAERDPTTTHWIDVAHRFASPEPSARPVPLRLEGGALLEDRHCRFRRRFGVRIPSGRQVTIELPPDAVEGTVELRLAGCYWNNARPGREDTGELSVALTRLEATERSEDAGRRVHEAGAETPFEHAIQPPRGWWQRSWEIEGVGPGDSLVVRYEGPPNGVVLLDELVVQHPRRLVPTPESSNNGEGRLILLVSADTLRPDAIGALGCDDCDTPNLDRLVAASQWFTPHYSAASWTKPSHASLLSGLLPAAHGSMGINDPITTSQPMLAERLRSEGFRTIGAADDVVWLDPKWGFSRGFDLYRVEPWTAGQTFRWALNEITQRPQENQFVFLHVFEPHSDVDVLPYEGINAVPEAIRERFGVEGYGCRQQKCSALLLVDIREGRIDALEREPEILRFLYHAGVQEFDRAVGQLIDGLQALGRWDDALIVFTSDHGEALMEHGRLEHGENWDSMLRVPLLIKWPGGHNAGTRSEDSSSALDVAATILRAAGPETELPTSWYGRPLQDRDPTQPDERPIFSGTFVRSIWLDGWKLTLDKGKARLYDLTQDPDELIDRQAEHPERRQRMLQLLERRDLLDRQNAAATEGVALSPQEEERLRALGYLN